MIETAAPSVIAGEQGRFVTVVGTFCRSIAEEHRRFVLNGSVRAGRYSTTEQPTLYLSATPGGVEAAMRAHENPGETRVICELHVDGGPIFDLRDRGSCRWAGIDARDAAGPWQDEVARDGEPASWRVRRRLEEVGAAGLIDPSRSAPGLWHLVLFAWNVPGSPAVRVIPRNPLNSGAALAVNPSSA